MGWFTSDNMMTQEEKRASRLAAYKKYHASEKGKAKRRLYENTSPKVVAKQARYYASEKGQAYHKAWEKAHPDRKKSPDVRQRVNARTRERYATEPEFKIMRSLRVRIKRVLRFQSAKKLRTTLELTGCSPAHLRAWLEFWMKPGMTWENHGDWHIDHKKPCASFDLSKVEEQRKCFHYTNLEPLWAEDNLKKGKVWQGLVPKA